MKNRINYFSLVIVLVMGLSFVSCDKSNNNNDDDDNVVTKPTYTFVDSYSILIYGSSACSYCDDLEVELDEAGVDYTAFNIQNSEHSVAMWQKLHATGYANQNVDLPVVEITTDNVSLLIRPDFVTDIVPLITVP